MARRVTAKQLQQRLQRPLVELEPQNVSSSKQLYAHMAKASEKEIQTAILEYLKRCSMVAWANRMNTGVTKYTDQRGRVRWVRFGFPGCSDILGQLTDGRFLAIEVKRHDGKATEGQLNFLRTVRAANGVAMIVRSVDDVIEGLNSAKN